MSNKTTESFSINKFKKIIQSNGGFSRQNYFTCSFIFDENGEQLVTNKLNSWNTDDLKNVICKSATLPSFTVESSELGYFGRKIKIPSNRTYEPITLTFTNTNNNRIRDILFYWQSALNTPFTNVRNLYGENKEEGGKDIVGGNYNNRLYTDIILTHYDVNNGTNAAILGNIGIISDLTSNIIKSKAESGGARPIDHVAIVSDEAAGIIKTLFNSADHRPIAKYTLQQAFPTSIGGLNFSHETDDFQDFSVQFVYQSMGYEFF